MTNFEKIKEMSLEEMAEQLEGECCFCKLVDGQSCNNTECKQGASQWLKSEVETNEL